MNDLDRGATLAIRLLQRAMKVTEDETEPYEYIEGIEAAIKEGGIGLAIRREMDFEKTLNIPGEFSVREFYGRFPVSLARFATPSEPDGAQGQGLLRYGMRRIEGSATWVVYEIDTAAKVYVGKEDQARRVAEELNRPSPAALRSVSADSTAGLESLRALSDAATPGPWREAGLDIFDDADEFEFVIDAEAETIIATCPTEVVNDSADAADRARRTRHATDAAFIVGAVNYVRAALAASTDEAQP